MEIRFRLPADTTDSITIAGGVVVVVATTGETDVVSVVVVGSTGPVLAGARIPHLCVSPKNRFTRKKGEKVVLTV